MHPSRSSAAAARRRTGLAGLLALSFTAGVAAVAADLSARDVPPLPVALEFAALLGGAAAVRLALRPADTDTGVDTAAAVAAGEGPRPEQNPGTAQGIATYQSLATPRPAPAPPAARIAQAPPLHPRPAPAAAAVDRHRPSAGGAEDPHASTRRAFVNLARRIQGAVNRQLRELRELEARHGADPEVFGDLLQVDHATALIGRLADSLAVLGGDRPARRWQRPIPLVSVLRGAMSRITEYRRVEIGPLPEGLGVDGGAVEALVHALAELLDNATRYSPPDTRVRLGARSADGAILIEVVDAGVGLTPTAARQADLLLRTREFGLELASLGDAPRLGLAVVGRLAHAIGFEASLHPVDGGGLCARIRVPHTLVRDLPQADLAPVRPDQRPHSHRAAQTGRASAQATPPAVTAHGLPQRRRRVPDTADAAASAPLPASQHTNTGAGVRTVAAGSRGAPAPGLWLSAFQAGLRGEADDGASRGDGRAPE